jgi:uncharacterized protein (TIRG00374 family)
MATIVFLIVIFAVVVPRVVDYGEVAEALRGVPPGWMAVLAIAAVINLVTFPPTLMAALPGLRFRAALAVTLASTASTYVAPGGAAVGMAFTFAMLRGWGFRGQEATRGVAISSVFNLLFTFSAPGVALMLLTLEGGTHTALRTTALVGLLVFTLILGAFTLALGSARQAEWLGDVAARAASRVLRAVGRAAVDWSGRTIADFREDTVRLLKQRWPALTAGTLAGHLTVYLCLILTLRAVGIGSDEITIAESFAAWTLARLLAALPITPGGFGIVEVGLSGSLIAFGGDQAEVVAAVIVYRFLTVIPPLLLGAVFGATWRRHHPGWEEQSADA